MPSLGFGTIFTLVILLLTASACGGGQLEPPPPESNPAATLAVQESGNQFGLISGGDIYLTIDVSVTYQDKTSKQQTPPIITVPVNFTLPLDIRDVDPILLKPGFGQPDVGCMSNTSVVATQFFGPECNAIGTTRPAVVDLVGNVNHSEAKIFAHVKTSGIELALFLKGAVGSNVVHGVVDYGFCHRVQDCTITGTFIISSTPVGVQVEVVRVYGDDAKGLATVFVKVTPESDLSSARLMLNGRAHSQLRSLRAGNFSIALDQNELSFTQVNQLEVEVETENGETGTGEFTAEFIDQPKVETYKNRSYAVELRR